jgi:hypothetical protein
LIGGIGLLAIVGIGYYLVQDSKSNKRRKWKLKCIFLYILDYVIYAIIKIYNDNRKHFCWKKYPLLIFKRKYLKL